MNQREHVNQLVIVDVDDWSVVYVNGAKVYENHSTAISQLDQVLPDGPFELTYHGYPENAEIQIHENGVGPDKLSDLDLGDDAK
jgi:hypothetical protein